MLTFLAQAVIKKEDVQAIIERQTLMLRSKGKSAEIEHMPYLKAEMRSFEFYGKYSDIMHSALKEDTRTADLLTSDELKRVNFLTKAFIRTDVFRKVVTSQLESTGTQDEPICIGSDTMDYDEFLTSYTASFDLASAVNGDVMKIIFQHHAKMQANKYVECVGHQLEMCGLAADVTADSLEDPMSFRHFLAAYLVDLAKCSEAQGAEFDDLRQKEIAALVFSVNATMDGTEFTRLVERQAKMLNRKPQNVRVPRTMSGPEFNQTYKAAMRGIFSA